MRLLVGICFVVTMMLTLGDASRAADTSPPNEMLLGRDAARELLVLRGLMKMGAIDQAANRLGRMGSAIVLLDIRILREFEPLWTEPTARQYLDVNDFADRNIAAAKVASERNPKNLQARAIFVEALHWAGRLDEAVAAGQETLRSLYYYAKDGDQEGDIRTFLAYSLASQGNYDAATAALLPMVRAATPTATYFVSTTINYANLAFYLGRYEEARRATRLANRGGAAPFGQSNIRSIDICALHALRQDGDAEKLLDVQMKSQYRVSLSTLEALLCLDRTDQAASALIAMLGDQGLRAPTLRGLQDCMDSPRLPTLWRERQMKLLALRDRPDVREAIDKAGIVISVPSPCSML